MLGAQTAGTKVQALPLSTNHDNRRMDVWLPPPIGMTLGMTDRITELRAFPTNIALQNRYSLTNSEIYSNLY
jgi:hypothetical protein